MEPKVPTDLRKVLAAAPLAETVWKSLPPIARRDFIFWIESARLPETRKRQVTSVPSRLASGKRRPCCFTIVPMDFYKSLNSNPKAKVQWKGLTPNGRRNFVSWMQGDKQRMTKACVLLAAGKHRP